MCGEKMLTGDATDEETGSPPHVRGKGKRFLLSQLIIWITPACAGKSGSRYREQVQAMDHPRMCGEKKVMRGAKDKRMGSPPHVRGKEAAQDIQPGFHRITPACAGKSDIDDGETSDILGSPPHVRGKADDAAISLTGSGITPACAGKSAQAAR